MLALIATMQLGGCGGGGGGTTSQTLSEQTGIKVSHKFWDEMYEVMVPSSIYNWVKANTSPLTSVAKSPNDDFSDLSAFGAAVGDARIVSLTEDTHGDATAFELMNRQVQYLHQKKGFDVLVMESAMFDTDAVWRAATEKGGSIPDLAPGRIFFMYSKNDSARKVLQYVDQQKNNPRPLVLAGFDQPAGGDASIRELVPALTQFLSARGSALPSDPVWANFASVANQTAALTLKKSTNTSDFFAIANRIKAEVCSASKPNQDNLRNDASWWCLQINGLIAAAQRLPVIETTGFPPSKDPREAQMAANALWLVTQLYPDKKVIFWSNTTHGTREYSDRCTLEQIKICSENYTVPSSAFAMISPNLGKSLYVVKNTAMAGLISDYAGGPHYSVEHLPENVLMSLKALNINQAFINAPSDPTLLARLTYSQVLRPYVGDMGVSSIFGRNMDGLFVYPLAIPARRDNYPVVPLP